MRYKSSDGVLSSSDPQAVAAWEAIGARMESEKIGWTEALREMGVKLAHPDDGWVKRDAAEPHLSLSWYPQFNDSPEVGDLIALGYPYGKHWDGDFNYRLVRVTRIERGTRFIQWTHYYYEDTGARLPATQKRKWRWSRHA